MSSKPTKIISPAKKLSITANEYEGAIKEWFIDEIRESPGRFLELAKFFLAVSTATVTALVALEKFYESRISYKLFGSGIIILFISIIAAVAMMIPKIKALSDVNDDLVAYFESQARVDAAKICIWALLWLIGTFTCGVALRYY